MATKTLKLSSEQPSNSQVNLEELVVNTISQYGAAGLEISKVGAALKVTNPALSFQQLEVSNTLCNLSTSRPALLSSRIPLLRVGNVKKKLQNFSNGNHGNKVTRTVKYIHSNFVNGGKSVKRCYLCGCSNEHWELIGGNYESHTFVVLLRMCLPLALCEGCFRYEFLERSMCQNNLLLNVGRAVLPPDAFSLHSSFTGGSSCLHRIIETFGFSGVGFEELFEAWKNHSPDKCDFNTCSVLEEIQESSQEAKYVLKKLLQEQSSVVQNNCRAYPAIEDSSDLSEIFCSQQLDEFGTIKTRYFAHSCMFDHYLYTVEQIHQNNMNLADAQFAVYRYDKKKIVKSRIVRGFSDFLWLQREIRKYHTHDAFVYSLPQRLGPADFGTKNYCKLVLETFLTFLVSHPVLKFSPVLQTFFLPFRFERAKEKLFSFVEKRETTIANLGKQHFRKTMANIVTGYLGKDILDDERLTMDSTLLENLARVPPQKPIDSLNLALGIEMKDTKGIMMLCNEAKIALLDTAKAFSRLCRRQAVAANVRWELGKSFNELAIETLKMKNTNPVSGDLKPQSYLAAELMFAFGRLNSASVMLEQESACYINAESFRLLEWKRTCDEFSTFVRNEIKRTFREMYEGIDTETKIDEVSIKETLSFKLRALSKLESLQKENEDTIKKSLVNFVEKQIEIARKSREQWQNMMEMFALDSSSYDSKNRKVNKFRRKKGNPKAELQENTMSSVLIPRHEIKFNSLETLGKGKLGFAGEDVEISCIRLRHSISAKELANLWHELESLKMMKETPFLFKFKGILHNEKTKVAYVISESESGFIPLSQCLTCSDLPVNVTDRSDVPCKVLSTLLCVETAKLTALGLQTLHKNNVAHGDFRAENVMIAFSGPDQINIKLRAFGLDSLLSKNLHDGELFVSTNISSMCLTISAQHKGSFETWKSRALWTVPEMLSVRTTDESKSVFKVDIYRFGILLWQLITRQPLYPHIHATKVMFSTVFEDLRPSTDLLNTATSWSEEVKALVAQCWNQDPKDRPRIDHIVEILSNTS